MADDSSKPRPVTGPYQLDPKELEALKARAARVEAQLGSRSVSSTVGMDLNDQQSAGGKSVVPFVPGASGAPRPPPPAPPPPPGAFLPVPPTAAPALPAGHALEETMALSNTPMTSAPTPFTSTQPQLMWQRPPQVPGSSLPTPGQPAWAVQSPPMAPSLAAPFQPKATIGQATLLATSPNVASPPTERFGAAGSPAQPQGPAAVRPSPQAGGPAVSESEPTLTNVRAMPDAWAVPAQQAGAAATWGEGRASFEKPVTVVATPALAGGFAAPATAQPAPPIELPQDDFDDVFSTPKNRMSSRQLQQLMVTDNNELDAWAERNVLPDSKLTRMDLQRMRAILVTLSEALQSCDDDGRQVILDAWSRLTQKKRSATRASDNK